MPGIFGFYINNEDSLKAQELSKSMAQSLQHHDGQIVDSYYYEKNLLALGRVHLGVFNPLRQPVIDNNNRVAALFDGELYNREELCKLINNDVNTDRKDDAFLLLYLWLKFGLKTFEKLDGQFAAVIADITAQKLYLISDRFGLKPVYYAQLDGRFLFAGEVKGILCSPLFDRSVEFAALSDLFTFGFVMGEKTLFSKAKLVPPASCLEYDHAANSVKIKSYYALTNLFKSKGIINSEKPFEHASQAFHEAVQKMTFGHGNIGMSLSAGLDSRSILAAAGNNCRSIGTYTLGVPGCADQSGAAELAQIAGTRHEFVPIERAYFQSFLQNAEKMCGFTDGLYMPHEFTEIRALDYLQQAKTEILVRGHGGEIAKASLAWPLQVDQHLMELCNAQEIIDCLYEKACFVSTGLKKFCLIKSKSVKTSWKKLFAPVFYQEVKGRSRESLEQSCGSALSLLSPGDLAVYIYIKENIRRHMVTSLQTFRNYTEIRLPFLDFSFLKSILSLDISKRLNPDFHRAVVETYCPAMIKVPDSNTGASLDASPLEEIILEKIHLLLRLVGAKGHRHYTEFQKWLRQQHRDLIAQVIFSKRTLEREYYEPHELKHIFQQHISGHYNHSYLLGTVLGIELWHRQFVD